MGLEESLQKEEATPVPLACYVCVSQKKKEVVTHTPSALATCPVEVEVGHQNQEGSPVPPAENVCVQQKSKEVVPHKAVQLASHKEEGRKCALEVGEIYQKERQAVPHACPVCLQRKEVGTHREEVCATCQVELEQSLQKEEATSVPLACHVCVSQKRSGFAQGRGTGYLSSGGGKEAKSRRVSCTACVKCMCTAEEQRSGSAQGGSAGVA